MMFANTIFSAQAAHGDDRPPAVAEWVAGDAPLYTASWDAHYLEMETCGGQKNFHEMEAVP
jgi:hypothetical protein